MPVYKFSPYLFDTDLEQVRRGDEVLRLEPQQTTLLQFLIQQKATVVSRDQIAQEVWQGLVVEDNTISKAITRLRKVLEDDAKSPKYIKTVPKKGYQFIAHIQLAGELEASEPKETDTDAEPESESESKVLRKRINVTVVATLLILLVLAVVFIRFESQTSQEGGAQASFSPALAQPSAITYREGRDTHAHLSPDGSQLLFVGATGSGFGLFHKEINQATARQLLTLGAGDIYPKWRSNASFVYSDIDESGLCQVIERSLSAPQRFNKLTSCLSRAPVEVQVVAQGKRLYWLDDSGSWLMELASQQRTRLSFDTANLDFQQVSPDEKFWGSLKQQDSGSEISVYQISDQTLAYSLSLPHQISHFRWDAESRAIYYLSEHPAKQIWKYSLEGEKTLIANTSFGSIYELNDPPSINSLEFVLSTVDLDIVTLDFATLDLATLDNSKEKNNEEVIQVNSTFADYHPAMSADLTQVAFASKRTGSAQIWLKNASGDFAQLTQFDRASFIYVIEWSPDNRHILVQRNEHIYIIDTQSKRLDELPISAKNKIAWQWTASDTLAFIDVKTQSLFSFNLKTQDQQLLKATVKHAQYTDGYWYIQETDQQSVSRYTSDFQEKKALFHQLEGQNWIVNQTNLFLIDNATKELRRVDAEGDQVVVLRGFNTRLRLRNAGTNRFIFHKISSSEANVYQIQL